MWEKCTQQSLTCSTGSGNVGRAPRVMSASAPQSVVLPEGVILVITKRGHHGISGHKLSQHLHHMWYEEHQSGMAQPSLKTATGSGTSQRRHLRMVLTSRMAVVIYLPHMPHGAIVKMHRDHSCRLHRALETQRLWSFLVFNCWTQKVWFERSEEVEGWGSQCS